MTFAALVSSLQVRLRSITNTQGSPSHRLTTTTVVTAEGNFQVRGAVSAAIGNPVALKKEKASAGGERASICITSAIKSACYQLL